MRVFRGYKTPSTIQSTVLTLGNFDGVHLGHRALFAHLLQQGSRLQLPTAVMTLEPHPREFFTPQQAPARLSVLREKLELFAEAGLEMAFVCRFNKQFASLSAHDFILRVLVQGLHASYVLVGDDFRFGADRKGDFQLLQECGRQYGFQAERFDNVLEQGSRVSSSAVRSALAAGDMARAEVLLGRAYMMDGRVVHGDKVGRDLGFATANIRVKHLPLPLAGVFAVSVAGSSDNWRTRFGSDPLPGVANLGTRPTLSGVRTLLEVHLFNFKQDIYGEHISVNFRKKLRDERRFANFDALKAQIAFDAAAACSYFACPK